MWLLVLEVLPHSNNIITYNQARRNQASCRVDNNMAPFSVLAATNNLDVKRDRSLIIFVKDYTKDLRKYYLSTVDELSDIDMD